MPGMLMAIDVFNRCIELIPIIAVASFTWNTVAFTWLNNSGWSGCPCKRSWDTKGFVTPALSPSPAGWGLHHIDEYQHCQYDQLFAQEVAPLMG